MRSTTGIAAAPDLPGLLGLTGSAGPQGPIGETGPEEPQGPAGSISDFADFYAIMPPDNDDPIEPGSPSAFPRTGPVNGSTIVRMDDSSFRLTTPGIYQVLFRVGIRQ
ncbi:MAG: collagen-like protein, partial [Clostridia bacterium]|nr:collagen-like protein [Clostridia bacterium]